MYNESMSRAQNGDLAARACAAVDIGIVVLSERGEIAFANPRAEKIIGLPHQEITALTLRNANWHLEDTILHQPESFDELVHKVITCGEHCVEVRYSIALPNGRELALLSDFSPLVSAQDQRTHIVATLEDLADRRRIEEEKNLREEQLRRAQRMESIGRLAGGVAHNLNNILSPIIGYTDMALDTLPTNDPLYVQMEEIRDATRRATDLVKQLLAFGRKQSFELRQLNLSHVVADLKTILRETIREDIDLAFRLDDHLGYVRADLSQIQQIVVDLALNACEAMPDGGRITITSANVAIDAQEASKYRDMQAGPYVLLEVSDTGRGMDEETLSHVFEPFFTTKETSAGAGLGLATVYGIVRQHGGHIRVESEPQHGASFSVYFPRFLNVPAPIPKVASKPKPQTGHETILIVEDEESLLRFTCIVLRKVGYHVLEASTGSAALKIGTDYKGPIHLLLTDVIMPEMNGKELYHRLIKSHPEMKILYTSGYPDNVIARHGVLDPGENLLPKPTTVDKLTLKVRDTLNK